MLVSCDVNQDFARIAASGLAAEASGAIFGLVRLTHPTSEGFIDDMVVGREAGRRDLVGLQVLRDHS